MGRVHMTTQENKALVGRYIDELWVKGNVHLANEFIHNKLVNHTAVVPVKQGPDAIREAFTLFRRAFPDWQTKITHLIAEGDIVVVRWVSRGTNTGAVDSPTTGRITPTNKQATWSGTTIYRIADGKIAEIWANVDALQQARQLGLISGARANPAAPRPRAE
jgi:predicted ester cyclase